MTGAGGGLRAWGSLLLLGLCSWTGARAAASSTISNLTVQNQTSSSITLSWKVPEGSEPENYCVQWTGDGNATVSQNTTNTTITVKGLEAGTLYEFSVYAVKDGFNSSVHLNACTAPSEVTALQKQNQTDSSITLQWEAPADPQPQFYVYWVHWASRGHPQRKRGPQGHQDNQTGSTNRTHYTVEALVPGTWYCFNVWAESYGVRGYKQSLNASTAPDPANITSCVITSGGHEVILAWSCPQGGYEAFELEVKGQPGPQNSSSCGDAVKVSLLRPAQSSSATVTTVWDEMRAPSASVACHVESGHAGVIAGAVVSVLLLLVLVGLLLFFLKRRRRKREKKPAPKDLEISAPGQRLQNRVQSPFWDSRSFIQRCDHQIPSDPPVSSQVKCEHYWPLDAQPFTHGHLQVTLVGEEVAENWAVRNLKLCHVQQQKTLPVRQFHYMTWPDHGVPHSPDPLLAFWRMLRQWLDQTVGGGPPIVHCR
ncbi:PREDICTED: receptor-type tyrosine-protein phosphatase H [Bison bison bison]|uniref:receptor protein-tyrosine kinase n=1 Tax=Bison bison bison TaxID=43346 RepID=A0A6P3H9D0_BISBB|nr:PREDICTED: receptor-type tyrosine-protein phosphatase H [Bison bison bison]